MISLRGRPLAKKKGHSKTNSTDTLCSQKRTRFLSLVTGSGSLNTTTNNSNISGNSGNHDKPPPGIKTVSQLKKVAMGHRTTRSVSEEMGAFVVMDQNKPNSNFK